MTLFSKGEKMFFLKKQMQPNLVEGVFFYLPISEILARTLKL